MTLYPIVLLIATCIWAAYEIWLVRVEQRRGKGGTEFDRGSRYLNFAAIILGISAAAILSGVKPFIFPGGKTSTIFWLGIAMMLLGLALRIWAVRRWVCRFAQPLRYMRTRESFRVDPTS
jgi:hypothetical protein